MIVRNLSLINFRNHLHQEFHLSESINCFVGNNGIGKTNVLDALHYLSVGKSFLGISDGQTVSSSSEEAQFFTIDAEVQREDKNDRLKILFAQGKKTIKKNDKAYERLADHIGYLPSVIISPYDANLISDSGESRRKFVDAMISQTDAEYLHAAIQYQKALQQRNALLKYFAKNRAYDEDSLEIYETPLTKYGNSIFQKRKTFIEKLNPIVQNFYQILSGGKEQIHISYQTHLQEDTMENLLAQSREKDRALTYTSKGVHKDDLLFQMNEMPIKRLGSQGQQKSFLIALKLAQISRIRELTGKNPIVLLDDIFDKLDDQRVSYLIDLLNRERFGQIFLTDTHLERTQNIVQRISSNAKIFHLS